MDFKEAWNQKADKKGRWWQDARFDDNFKAMRHAWFRDLNKWRR